MLTVDDYDRIRRKVIVEGLSQREVAKELGHGRNTVAKALKHSSPPEYRRTQPVSRPAIDPFQHIIDTWIEDDKKRPRKQRHTAQRVYERLRDEYGYAGSSSAVRRYVQHIKATGGEVYFPLQFDPGEELQIDWGEARCLINGEEFKAMLFCARLCHSGASFVHAYHRQKQESFLDGHVRAFEFFDGVARRLAYDNLKSAVITVGRGRERKLTRKFKELKSHYLFESRFCNVARGNEKGHVENLVKYSQRKFMTPLPEVSSLEELNSHLLAACMKDLERQRSRSDKSIKDLLDEDRDYFLALPATPFEACIQQSTFAGKQSLVRFDTNDYSVPVEYAHHQVLVKGFVDRVNIYVAGELIARHARSYESSEFILNPLHYIPLLERKPGGIHNARPFKGEPWGEDFGRMRSELEYRYGSKGTKKFVKVLLLFSKFPEEDVKCAVNRCVKSRAFSEDAVMGALLYEPRSRWPSLDMSPYPDLQLEVDGRRSLSEYDLLLDEQGPL